MSPSTESAYRALAMELRDAVVAGEYEAETPLPTEMRLAEEKGVSRQTVRRAFQELVAEGLVYRVPGRGTFATPKETRYGRAITSIDDLLALPLDTEMEVIRPLGGDFDRAAATALQLTVRQLYSVQFLRHHNGRPFCLTTAYLPSAFGLLLESEEALTTTGSLVSDTVIGMLTARGHHVATAEQAVTAISAEARHAEALGCAVGAPLLHVERTYFDTAGIPLEHAASEYLPDVYTLRQSLGRSRPAE